MNILKYGGNHHRAYIGIRYLKHQKRYVKQKAKQTKTKTRVIKDEQVSEVVYLVKDLPT